MNSRLALHPDLTECALEDRTLLAYAPTIPGLILTSGGYIVLSTPPGLNSSINTAPSGNGPSGGSGGSSGGNMATSFNISGFGPSSMVIGNATGYPALNASAVKASSAGGGGGSSSSNSGGGNGTGGSSSVGGFGGTFSSGYSFALGVVNNFGMTTTPVGSVPVHSFGGGGEPGSNVAAADSSSNNGMGVLQGNNIGGIPNPALGALQNPSANLLKTLLGKMPGSLYSMPGSLNQGASIGQVNP